MYSGLSQITRSGYFKKIFFGLVVGAVKSGYVAVKVGGNIGSLLMAQEIGAALFGAIGLIAGLAKAAVHKTKVENAANKYAKIFGL